MKQKADIDEMENARVTFDKGAFKAKSMRCDNCSRQMKKAKIELDVLDDALRVRLDAFRCAKCGKEYLDFGEARKLDRALLISRLLREDSYRLRKALSFDGDNYIFRIPVDIARSLGKSPYADITPLSSKDLLIHLNKG
ncbi:hypothetical protein HYV82_01840 [Candidatus Woesearchaeota archaeon]|nr:hypothetical protein [Candidatus Woesearchaeota archaeon]